eukprot:TRINITY_DN5120_c0_g1_i3.p1 TRINITY_DN5120_c0_g1~~TRINITY_DN5120_c0_g1_i3.p1  ORF type:complete len:335 (+),score=35.47 TRINITY_DN5120_c0_g1_i3:430-1434(+)
MGTHCSAATRTRCPCCAEAVRRGCGSRERYDTQFDWFDVYDGCSVHSVFNVVCLLAYFFMVSRQTEDVAGNVTVTRCCTDDPAAVIYSNANPICRIRLHSGVSGAPNMVVPWPGSTFVRNIAAPESIVFCEYPEVFVATLCVPPLQTHEALIVGGAVPLVAYSGSWFDGTLLIKDIFCDRMRRGSPSRKLIFLETLADALESSFKAFVAFSFTRGAIATSKVGGYDYELNFLQQVIAASMAGRALDFTPSLETAIKGDFDFTTLNQVCFSLIADGWTVGALFSAIFGPEGSNPLQTSHKQIKKMLVADATQKDGAAHKQPRKLSWNRSSARTTK